MKKKAYFIGDMLNNTGPAIVNKSYYPYLNKNIVFCFSNNKIIRSIHFLFNFIFVNNIIISGFSKLNCLLLIISKLFKKNTVYLMHGFAVEEVKYNDNLNGEKKIKSEYRFLKRVDKIVCVSEFFSEHLKKTYPEFKDKICFINNGISIDYNETKQKKEHKTFTIISVGGGVKQKNNMTVCKAINSIKKNIRFIVIGKLAEDGDRIKDYSFVEYYESLPHEEVIKKMRESDLYIQNSYFETFGLAIIEALESGCNLLISKNIGVCSILNNLKENDIILNNEDIEEISKKVLLKMSEKKCNITYDKEEVSCEQASKKLLEMM